TNLLGEAVVPARQFGGVGLMVQEPRLVLTTQDAPAWSAEGPVAERALGFARLYVSGTETRMPPQRLVVASAPPEHRGLGTGTQLALAVATALNRAQGCPLSETAELAAR